MSVAVFDGTVLHVDGHRYRVPEHFCNEPLRLELAAQLGERARVAQLWTMPSVEVLVDEAWNVVRRPSDSGDAGLAVVALARDKGTCGPWREARDAPTLLGALARLERVLDVPWQRSPGGTGAQLLRAQLRRRGLYIAQEPPPPARGRQPVERLSSWLRPLDADERSHPWLHRFDKNSTFLGTGQAVEVGIGEPVHRLRPEFRREHIGYWLVRVGPADPRLFDPTGARQASDEPRWLTTPSVAVAVEAGMLREVLEAWLYPGHTRVFRPLCERFVEARAQLEADSSAASMLAIAALKRCYAAIMSGYLAGRFHEADAPDDRDPLYRPDWRDLVLATSRVNIWRNVRDAGLPICAAMGVDAVLVTSTSPDPFEAAGRLRLGQGVGHWKHARTYDLGDWLLADGRWRPSAKAAA